MKIVGLLENTTCEKECKSKHGLSLYIETPKHKLLFDLGPDATFIHNAEALGVDIKAVDTVIISHGHGDHGGGLKAFLEVNETAKVYIQQSAFEKYYSKVFGMKFNVSLNENFKFHPQVKLLEGSYKIDEELSVFINPSLKRFIPEGNKKLYKSVGTELTRDNFIHEQNLILRTEGKVVLIAGCAHRGIVNIVDEAERLINGSIDYVIGGFHLTDPLSLIQKPSSITLEVGEALKTRPSSYFTCHCTGEAAYAKLKGILNDQMHYLRTGSQIEL